MTSVTAIRPPSTRRLRNRLATVASHLARSDQRHWAGVLEGLAARLDDEPGAVARAVLALFEGPGAWNVTPTEGDWALDTIALTTDGVAKDRPGVTWEEVLDYPRQRHRMYQAAVDLWLKAGDHAPLPRGEDGAVKLADYGWGCQIWARSGAYFMRYDRGGHQAAWREDAISGDEARWGLLGGKHFPFLILAVTNRLRAAEVDPWTGSPTPLPEP